MTALRQRMLEELQRHNYSKHTIRLYLFAVKDFACHFKKSPDLLTQEHMREFQLYLLNVRKRFSSAQRSNAQASPQP